MTQTCSTCGRENFAQPHLVFTNDDLLTEILIRSPILCIYLFTTVSKQRLQILTSPDFTNRCKKIPNLDPPVGIFNNHHRRLFKCEFVSLDPRLESRKSTMDNSFTFGSNEEADHVKILQSCNGLLLCSGSGLLAFYYVYNPSINLFKRLPQPKTSHDDSHLHATGVLRMTFDPTKSCDYKVVQLFACIHSDLEIQVYSLETDIPGILHLQGRLFESRGCLLLACRDDIDSREFTIYEMVKGCFVWTVRYLVNADEFMTPFHERWSIQSTMWSIGLGEREEDSFLVIKLSGKVVKYNILSKTISQIFDIGSNPMDDDYEFFPSYTVAHNLYKFIPSFSSV
ncbi:hypothetical protein Tco_0551954 [Tanacetum coccineum]